MRGCDRQWVEILSAWQDGEATDDEVVRVGAHLEGCARCRTAQAGFEQLHEAFRPLRVGSVPRLATHAVPRPWTRSPGPRRPLALAGALAAALAVVLWSSHRDAAALADELEARHLTAFARSAPCDFTSSDPAAVRAWVAGNVGYDVEVPVVPGARLLGARRCTVHGGVTASLLYRRGDEPLSLFLPRAGSPAETEAVQLSRVRSGCTVGRLGAAVCARPGLFAVAESQGTALAALESN
jgi:anti-sigma factor RsiW